MIGRVSSPTFVGRREELGALADAVSAAATGSESVVLISGEPGIGKSRLISEFAAQSHESGAIVLVGECPPLGQREPREIDVLSLIADGKTNRQIATELFISHKTASAHVSHILSKLSVPNRTAAAATARRIGLGREA